MNRLSGKIALVTGGTRGIGRAIVEVLPARRRLGPILRQDGGERPRDATWLPPNAAAEAVAADLSEADAPERLVARCKARFGGLDILVNNAGVISRAGEWELTPDEWDRVHDVNLRRSSSSLAPPPRSCASAAAAASSMCHRSQASTAGSPAVRLRLLQGGGDRFDAVARPTLCRASREGELHRARGHRDRHDGNWPQDLRRRLIDMTPLARFGDPEEVSGAAVLRFRRSRLVTGQTLSINGGAFMP